jgi:hypothetical protein
MQSEDPLDVSGFTHQEMRLIFERAGNAEATRDKPQPYTLAEIEAIGVEAGLDVGDIRRAAATVRDVSLAHRILGSPTRFQASHFVKSPLGQEGLAEVVDALRRDVGIHGELRFVPDGVEWQARPALGAIIVHFTPRRKGTRISVLVAREDAAVVAVLVGCAAGFVTGVVCGVAATVASNGVALLGLGAFVTGTVVGAYASMRLIWQRASRRAAGITKSLLSTIVSASESASEPTAEDVSS